MDTLTPHQNVPPSSPSDPDPPAAARPPVRRWTSWSIGAGVVLVVLAVVFALVGIPALVRFPLTTDVTVHYTGHFDLYVNQSTLEPLATPTVLPMTVDRTVKVRSGGFSTAVVTEDDTIRPGPLTYHQDFQYVMNRRTMAFENSPQTEMFSQKAKTDIAGSYRVNFPLGTTATGSYPVWNVETDKAAVVSHGKGPETLPGVTGVKVIEFSSDITGPVSPYYHHWLVTNGFPDSISPAQLEPRLAADGVNVSQLLATLTPLLTPAQRTLVDQVLSSPVPLDYTYLYRGIVGIEPRTGAMVYVDTTAEGLKVAPSLSGVDRLRPLLSEYAAVPGVATLAHALDELAAAPPQKVVQYTWVQTRASSQHVANLANNQIRSMNLVDAVPWVAGGLGVVLVVLGVVFRRRRRPAPAGRISPTATTSERVA